LSLYSHLFFDLDGTLTDPKIGITKSVRCALRHFGIRVDSLDELERFIGPPLRDSFREFYGFDAKQTEEAVAKYREYFLEQGIYENTLYPGMDDLLKNLYEQGKTLAIATSKPTMMAEKVLDYFHLRDYFTFISGAEMDGRRSAKRELLLYAFAYTGISNPNRRDCLMIGDRKHDILGARAVGIGSVGAAYGYGGRMELAEAGAAYIVENVEEMSRLLLAL